MNEPTPAPAPSRLSRGISLAIGAGLTVLLGMAWHECRYMLLAHLAAALLLPVLWMLVAVTWRRGFRWWLSRGGLRFALWMLLAAVSVVVLYYTEENWRGKRAYARLKREVEARGEKLDPASVIPPPVPEDQNFFLAPGMAGLLGPDAAPEGGAGGLKPASALAKAAWFRRRLADRGGPAAPTNAWLHSQFTDLAGWQRFFRHPYFARRQVEGALPGGQEKSEPEFPVAPQPQTPAADVLLALSCFEAELATLRAASTRPAARLPLPYELGWFAQEAYHRKAYCVWRAADVLVLRASAELAERQPEPACADVQLAFYLADTLRKVPFFAAHAQRITMLLGAFQPLWEGLAGRQWSEAQLATLQRCLEQMDPQADFATAGRGEALMTLSLCEHLLAYFHRRTAQLNPLTPPRDAGEKAAFLALRLFYPEGWLYQDQVWTYRYYARHVGPMTDGRWPIGGEATDRARVGAIMDPVFVTFVVPKLRHVFWEASRLYCYLEATRGQALIACGLERYRQANGRFPESLALLAPRYLDRLPLDPATGQPFIYRLTSDGEFLLYSVGWDQRDDQGEKLPGLPQPHSGYFAFPRVDAGDWVWRYPAGP